MVEVSAYNNISATDYALYLRRKAKSRKILKDVVKMSNLKFKSVNFTCITDFIELWKNHNRTSYIWLVPDEDFKAFSPEDNQEYFFNSLKEVKQK